MSKIYWIITDDVRIAQKFIRKNHLPRMLTEIGFMALMTKGIKANEEHDLVDDYSIRKIRLFNERLKEYHSEINKDVTIVSLINKVDFRSGNRCYKPEGFPEAFNFFTNTTVAMFRDGTRTIIRHKRQYPCWNSMLKDLKGDIPSDYGRMISKELKLAYDRNKPKRRILRNLLRYNGHPLNNNLATVYTRPDKGQPSTLMLLTNVRPKGFEEIDGEYNLKIGFTRDLIS